MEISELLRPFTIIYKEFKFFFRTYVYKSLLSKIDKTISKLL